jgi:membrane protease YdiL (CAAX protease family)
MLKDAARLLAYFAAILLVGALLAPPLFWAAQWLAAQDVLVFLSRFEFEKFFHRALLIAGILLLWPLLRWLGIRNWRDLGLMPNRHRWRDLLCGFLLATIPLLCCGALLLLFQTYSLRNSIRWAGIGDVVGASVVVPPVEELFFRGLILGILLRSGRRILALLFTSALFSILHFLKTPEDPIGTVNWTSGFISMAHAFDQFREPMLVAAGFTTLFLLGWILADARIRTKSLWLPIGLHAGWIFASGLFNKVARGQTAALPWLGKNLLIGIVPLSLGLLTWLLLRAWLRHEATRAP